MKFSHRHRDLTTSVRTISGFSWVTVLRDLDAGRRQLRHLAAARIAIAFDVTGSMKYIGDGDSGDSVSVPKPGSKAVQAQKG